MEDWRLSAFAGFMLALIAVGWLALRRKRRAQRTGDDPIYGIASLDTEADSEAPDGSHVRGPSSKGEP